jgi:hypothetical protein
MKKIFKPQNKRVPYRQPTPADIESSLGHVVRNVEKTSDQFIF